MVFFQRVGCKKYVSNLYLCICLNFLTMTNRLPARFLHTLWGQQGITARFSLARCFLILGKPPQKYTKKSRLEIPAAPFPKFPFTLAFPAKKYESW